MNNQDSNLESTSAGSENRHDVIIQLCGWVSFILSSLFYMASSFKIGDVLGFCGGALFFVACLFFFVPFCLQKR